MNTPKGGIEGECSNSGSTIQLTKGQLLQTVKGIDKKENYESLKPEGFEYAPASAKERRKKLEQEKDIQTMESLKKKFSYTSDGLMNILPLNKTFCKDISGRNKGFNYADAEKLAQKKGYKLMSDYNDTDTQQEKEQSDWYKVISVCSDGQGDTRKGRELFRDMAGCNERYWTSTPFKDETGKLVSGVVCIRLLNEHFCDGFGSDTKYGNRVCGLKDM